MPSIGYSEFKQYLENPEQKFSSAQDTDFDQQLYQFLPEIYTSANLEQFIDFLGANHSHQVAEWKYLDEMGAVDVCVELGNASFRLAIENATRNRADKRQPTYFSKLFLIDGLVVLAKMYLPYGVRVPETTQFVRIQLVVAAPSASVGGTDLIAVIPKKSRQQAAFFHLNITHPAEQKTALRALLEQFAAGKRPDPVLQAKKGAITGKPVALLEYDSLDMHLNEQGLLNNPEKQRTLSGNQAFRLKLYWQLRLASVMRQYGEFSSTSLDE